MNEEKWKTIYDVQVYVTKNKADNYSIKFSQWIKQK